MYIYIYIYMYMYICMYIYTCIYTCIYIYTCICICIYIRTSQYVNICISTYVHTSTHISYYRNGYREGIAHKWARNSMPTQSWCKMCAQSSTPLRRAASRPRAFTMRSRCVLDCRTSVASRVRSRNVFMYM